jgi:altronate dehydratase small subunit
MGMSSSCSGVFRGVAIVLHERDNVATALANLCRGWEVVVGRGGEEIRVVLLNDIPFGHKFALDDIPQNGYVVKYGEVIGRATKPIKRGEHVHIHNVESLRGRGDLGVNGS